MLSCLTHESREDSTHKEKMSITTSGVPYLGGIALWYAYGNTNIDRLRRASYNAGRFVSNRFAPFVPGWNLLVEPMLVSQCARLFVCMHQFIQGLTSDNSNVVEMERVYTEMEQTILDELTPPVPVPSA